MVFGFGAGKIDITVNGFNFKPGDTIEGKVTLKMNSNQKARGVKVMLIGEEISSSTPSSVRLGGGSISMGGNRTTGNSTTKKTVIFKVEQGLDAEREYQKGEEKSYDFKIALPKNLFTGLDFGNDAINQVAGIARTLTGNRSRITWTLRAYLDISMGFDVAKSIQLNITQ